ncbi:MAG: hypothetical protein ABIN00_02745 [candidate division WOR-3 bacterium]
MRNKIFLNKISFLIIGMLFFIVAIMVIKLGVLITEIFILLWILIVVAGIISGFQEDRKRKRKGRRFFDVGGVDLLVLGFILFFLSIDLINLSFRKNPFTLIIYLIGYTGIFLIVLGIFKIVNKVIKRFGK